MKKLTGGVSSNLLLSLSGLADIFANTPSVDTGKIAGAFLCCCDCGCIKVVEEEVLESCSSCSC
jgi:hypothetical protein